ncbi:MAG TPA: microviridin/marinostatin family tricyclic proteinase inhibitor [Pseudomonadota bacterium]|nr:microviridin/marinostatin family tricyclic proteinase inhibitor [Pseudomonadota bacterium]
MSRKIVDGQNLPFFAHLLSEQIRDSDLQADTTKKFPSDSDPPPTLRYPSDDDADPINI